MAKQVTFDVDARQALKKGIDIVAQSVRITLGPKGRNVVLEKKFGAPTVTNDGVTIVREIELKDPMENTGAQLLREVATTTNETLLAQTMINEGFRNVTAGANPMQLKIGIEKAVEAIVDEIKKLSVPVKGHEDVAHVAAISSQSDQIGTLIVNKLRGTFIAVAVKAPGFGDRRKAMLEDMAILTGGTVISEDLGLKLDQTKVEQLGKARKVTVTKDDTTIVEGAGKAEAIQARIKSIKAQVEETTSDFDKEKLQERLAKLAGGVAVIKVGAPTEVEQKEKKHRIEDALSATKAAVEEGIVAGGGTVLLQAQKVLEKALGLESDEKTGVAIVRKALEEPLRQIAANAGVEGSVIVEEVRKGKAGHGYDALNNKFTDMFEAGIVDPAKVTRSALQNAASIAAMVLTTEAVITEIPEKNGGGGMREMM